ncbi:MULTISPECIES: hypothetical protein [unclassified Streptomyces]|uniref:hypothetical protein n=1 Tax=unclassified Streptomyces TaxID=2593676 RepID=UPI0033305AC4
MRPARSAHDDGRSWTAEVELSAVAGVERCPFSVGGRDFRITFTDGSWCRLTSLEGEGLVARLTAA